MFVQGTQSGEDASGSAGASLSGVIAGHGLVCFVVYTAVTSAQTLADSSSTTWTLSKSINLTGGTIAVFRTTNAVAAGTHTVTASFSGGGNSVTILIEDDQAVYSGSVVGQTLVAPGAGNSLLPGATVGTSGGSAYQLSIDNSHVGATFEPQAGTYDRFLFTGTDTGGGSWTVANSATNRGGNNTGMAPGSGDSTGADTYGILAMGFVPSGVNSVSLPAQVVLVENPEWYIPPANYAQTLLFNRIYPTPATQAAFFLRIPPPPWTFFPESFSTVYPVVEAYSNQAIQPKQPAFIGKFFQSRRLDSIELEPERDDYRRWNHGVYWQYVRLYAAQLVGYTFTIPDLCDDPWLEWVHPKKSDESAIYPYRQINVFIRGQQFNLFFNQPKPWPVEGEADPVLDRKANYGVMLPWGRPSPSLIMPNVVGLPVAQAIGIIENLSNLPAPNLTYQNVLYQLPPYAPEAVLVGQLPAPPPIPAGIVIGQAPAPGAVLQFPFYTELIVSTGLVTLPGQGASTSYSQPNVIIGDNTPP